MESTAAVVDRYNVETVIAHIVRLGVGIYRKFGRCVVVSSNPHSTGFSKELVEFSGTGLRYISVLSRCQSRFYFDYSTNTLIGGDREISVGYFVGLGADVFRLVRGIDSRKSHIYLIS
ncbi:hypothetical protein EB093_00295 [bacterium]|nr:hypothetical protein [bacterium]